jgi:tRNA(fMet)-specific endonuclease VapC
VTSRGLLDTSTVILLGSVSDPSMLPDECLVSAITLAELSVGPLVATTDAERAARQAHLQLAEADFDVVAFDDDAARAFGAVAASLRTAGRKTSARAYDALIAATAISLGVPLFTCNPADFEGIAGLDLRAVAVPAS